MNEPARDEPATFARHDPAKTKDGLKPSGYILDKGLQDWSKRGNGEKKNAASFKC